jgi:hypothetical protein
MQLFVFVSLLIAVRAVVVPPVDSSGHFHSPLPTDVVPQGKNITINGVLTYVSLPKGRFDRTTAVLMLTGRLVVHNFFFRGLEATCRVDAFGLPSPDNLVRGCQVLYFVFLLFEHPTFKVLVSLHCP